LQNIRRIDEPPRGGACVGQDPEIWFPMADKSEPGKFSENYRQARVDAEKAKKICSACKIKFDCLSYALYHEMFGIWGGATERERRIMRRELKIIPIPRVPLNILLPNTKSTQ